MNEIRSHRDLIAWQKSFELGAQVHEITKCFPSDERFGLSSQLRRAGVSIASNIAEGYGRESTPDYIRFLHIARGSLYEVDTQLLFALRFGYLEQERHKQVENLLNESGRILGGLIRAVESSSRSSN